jgi:uncharacterized protein (TIGR03083 family)
MPGWLPLHPKALNSKGHGGRYASAMATAAAQQARSAIAALRRGHDELADKVGRLDGDKLRAQSGASEWTVADVLGHLGGASELALTTLLAGKADRALAPAVWARWDAMSPQEKASSFVASNGRLVEALESLDDEALEEKRLDVGYIPEPISVGFFVTMRLSELGQHRWDIDVAFDPAAVVPPYTVPFILDALPNFASFFAKPSGVSGRVAVTTRDPSKSYVLELTEQGATLSEGVAEGAGTRLLLPAEAFVRLLGGRLGPGHTPQSVSISGEIALDDLRRAFPGY